MHKNTGENCLIIGRITDTGQPRILIPGRALTCILFEEKMPIE